MSTNFSKNSQNYLIRLLYNSDTSCRKCEYVYKTNFGFMIEFTLIIRCKHSGNITDVKTKNMDKLVTKILRKTFTLLVKIISNGEHNFRQNKSNK